MITFQEALQKIPQTGKGCHPYLLTCANIGVREGVSETRMVSEILAAIPEGGHRTVSRKEVQDAVLKAVKGKLNGNGFVAQRTYGTQVSSFRKTSSNMLEKFLHPKDITVEDFVQASPVVFDVEDGRDQVLKTLMNLFNEDDRLFIGEQHSDGSDRIFTRDAWVRALEQYAVKNYPNFIIWNPVTGRPAKKIGDDKESLRCDNAVSKFKYCVVEFDELPLEDQLRFWAGCRLPLAALIFSGKKSFHGILSVEAMKIYNVDDWRRQVKDVLYKRWLIPLGVDKACSNASRLSRLPGALRQDSNNLQRLIYLNPAATPIYLDKA